MDAQERALVFESAMEDYRRGLEGLATRTLQSLVEDGSRHPDHLSYCGLLVATTEGRFEDAIALCREAAVKGGRRSATLYLNLAKVLVMAGRRRDATEALKHGLSFHPDDAPLRRELQHLVPRRKPVFSRLERRHPLNKYAGLARAFGGRLWVTFVPRVRRVEPRASANPTRTAPARTARSETRSGSPP